MDIISNTLTQNFELPYHTLILILSFPIITTIIGFIRYYLGIKTLGIYPHIMIIYSLYFFAQSTLTSTDFLKGLKYELLFIFAAVVSITIAKYAFDSLNLHIISKKNLILTIGVLGILLGMILSSILEKKTIVKVDFIGIIGILIVAESYLTLSIKKGVQSSLRRLVSTIVICSLIAFLISNDTYQSILVANTWIVVIFIFLNIFIGRYTGLRLSEVIRFGGISNEI